ncbi:MAG: M2 family metallopeptidase, partial [Telluria sp.]
MKNLRTHITTTAALVASLGLAGAALAAPAAKRMAPPTVADAEKFVTDAEALLTRLDTNSARHGWVYNNFITDDTEASVAQADEQRLSAAGELALKARRFKGLKLPQATARKLKLLQLSLMLSDSGERETYTRLVAGMSGSYGKGKYCPTLADGKPGKCMPLGELEKIMAESRD